MAENDPAQVARLDALVGPLPPAELAVSLCRWLQDAHEAAAALQTQRRDNHRGGWGNNTSFGVDRYQYLIATAGSLDVELPGLHVDSAFQSVLLKFERFGVYQMQTPTGPHGSLGDASDLRRELLTTNGDPGLLSRREVWLGDRQLLFLAWAGTEDVGLTGAWIGQGELYDNRVDWDWLVDLAEIAEQPAVPAPGRPLDPTIFDVPEPVVPLRPRFQRPSAAAD